MSSAGLLSGLGRGLALSGERMLKNVDRDAERAAQAERDEKQNQFTLERDATLAKTRSAESEAEHRRRIEAAKEAVLFKRDMDKQFTAEDQIDAQEALAASGGDMTKAFGLAKTPGGKEAIKAMKSMDQDDRKLDANLRQTDAQIAASGASTANAYDSIAGRREDRATKSQGRADEAKARDMLANFTRATQDGNTEAAQVLRTEYIRLTGKDPATTKDGDWAVFNTEDEYGNKTPGGLLNKNNAEVRPMPKPAAPKAPPPTAADIAATAKKYGMTEAQVKAKLGLQ